jgi:hypothetical protein
MRSTALALLIVSIAAALQSDAQDPAAPRRLASPVVATALQAPADAAKESGEWPITNSRSVDPITQLPFSDDMSPSVPAERPTEAAELFHCDFGATWDTNFDNWPDRWSREHSVDYPHYLPIKIVDEAPPAQAAPQGSAPVNRSLRIDLNGAAGAAHTPAINVDAMYTYVVEGYLRTEGLKHDEACLVLTFLDADRKPVQAIRSDRLRRTTDWKKVRIGPVAPTSKNAQSAIITLHLGPGDRADLRGSAWFSDIWFGRLPRMTLSADRRSHLYFDDESPQITCTASGFAEQHTKVVFELLDVAGNVVSRSEERLVDADDRDSVSARRGAAKTDPPASETDPPPAANPSAEAANTSAEAANPSAEHDAHNQSGAAIDPRQAVDRPQHSTSIFAGSAVWQPAIPAPGFYQVRVEMPGKTSIANQRRINLAMVRRLPAPAGGEFGWSIPGGEDPLTLTELAEVVGHSGCNWCKFPLWDKSQRAKREEQLVWFAERLSLRRVELVGLLCDPPAELRKQLGGVESQQAAGVFSMPTEMWFPSLEPIMTRLSLKVRWWQLGLDSDQSFIGYAELGRKIAQLKKQFSRYGQRVNLGLGWSWLNQLPDEKPTWDFLALSAEPPLTWEEQVLYLRTTKDKGCARWVVLEPLPREFYTLETRITDLAMRMIAAKMEGAEGVFIPDAFSDSAGVMNQDGTVGELFIPWRTTAHLLAGARPLGSLQLPANCRTEVFQRGEEIVMAVWSDRPTRVPMFLGDDARQIDLWGRQSPLPLEDGMQILQVGPVPLFFTEINAALMRTQMSVQFENAQLASQFLRPQANALTLKSHFPQSIRGRVRIVAPETWRPAPKEIAFKAAPAETMYQQFEVTLQPNATTGRQLVRLDFDLTADRRYQFSIYRQMEVGLSDIFAEAFTRLNERGELEVEQRITNETDEVMSFKCYLYLPPPRKRMMMHVEDHGRGVDLKTYRLYNGEELLGKTLFLRAEEINGTRILNLDVIAQP